MRLVEGYLFRCFFLSVVLVILTFSAGCQTATTSLFTASGSGWRVQEGQVLWRPQRGLPEFGGDLTLARHADGRSLIQFDKTPLTILMAQTTPTNWLFRVPQRQMGFKGHMPGPTRFTWLYLPAALAGEQLPTFLRFERKPDNGWRLENLRTGETLEGFLSP